MKLKPFSALLPSPDWMAQNPGILKGAKKTFPNYLQAQKYVQQQSASFYLLRITEADNMVRYGIAGLARTADRGQKKGGIHPHEKTLKAREQHHILNYRSSKHFIKPILLTCPDFDGLQKAMKDFCDTKAPAFQYAAATDFLIELFVIPASNIDYWQKLLDNIPAPVAIADGHHRISTAYQLMNEIPGLQQIPAVLIPANSLGIASFIRTVKVKKDEFTIADLSAYFTVTPIEMDKAELPKEKGSWLLLNANQLFKLQAKNTSKLTDPEWFDHFVLTKAFDINDSTADERLKTVAADAGIDSLLELKKKNSLWHFLPPPVSGDDFFAKIENREVFPPKTTRFSPRIPSGLLVYEFC